MGSDEAFEKHVRPVLVDKCFRCHGGQKDSGGLRVDSRAALLAGGDSGPALDLEHPSDSLLLLALRRDESVSAMPPDEPLEDQQVAALETWIKNGAPWPLTTPRFEAKGHWSFEPLTTPATPEVEQVHWPKNDIDAFVLARIEAAGKRPSATADRRTLIRRVTYDLTGLPPTPEEVKAFELDNSADALGRVIDRLLATPQYGEHWGRHWLDLVRYADTAGENTDHPLPHAWRYRNWVIESFNRDLPFDAFARAQIAGDLLAADSTGADYTDKLVATGYLAIARRFGHNIDKDIHLTHEDIIDNLGKTFLGLSLGCCRCHDHKYDPLTTKDYYGLYGILASTRISFPGCEPNQQPRDLVPLLSPADIKKRNEPIEAELARLNEEIEHLRLEQQPSLARLQSATGAITVSLSGIIEDGSSTTFPAAASANVATQSTSSTTLEVNVHRGEALVLSIMPRGNHGADSTRVDLEIAASDGSATWNTTDLVTDLLANNPHGDPLGNQAVWCFLDAHDGFQLLPEMVREISGRPELQAWRNGETPSVFVNTSDKPVEVWTTLPPKAFFVHPGPKGPVSLAWISPIDGRVSVRGQIADAHPGGDGVGWRIEHLASSEVGPAFATLASARDRLAELNRRKAELETSRDLVPVAFAVMEGSPTNARIQVRGEPTELGDEVPRKFLDILGGQLVTDSTSSGRRELATWLTQPDNPLFARVIVNRVWQWHFGRGLVTTPNDFGTRGTPPSHPELLDYLARDFIASGYQLKALHRKILSSATWQQAVTTAEYPELFLSGARRRLTAEELRDSLLAVSGELDLTPGVGHPFPPESTWSFTQHTPFAAQYDTNKRGVYLMQKRNRRDRFFALFDGPDPNASTPLRDVTTVPTQALYFLNDPRLHEIAAKFAKRVSESTSSESDRIHLAMSLLFGRQATAEEQENLAAFLRDYAQIPSGPEDETPWTALARILLSSNEVLYVD